jgi:hypothetical protein
MIIQEDSNYTATKDQYKVIHNLDEDTYSVFIEQGKNKWRKLLENVDNTRVQNFIRSRYIETDIIFEENCQDCKPAPEPGPEATTPKAAEKPKNTYANAKTNEDREMSSTERYLEEFINEGLSGGASNLAGNDGPYNGLGVPGDNQRQILSGEIFGSPAFAYQAPTSQLHNDQVGIQVSQAEVGQGVMRPIDNSSATNMYEQAKAALMADLVELSKRLVKANKIEEAKKLYNLITEGVTAEGLVTLALSLKEDTTEELKSNLFEAATWVIKLA